MKTSRPIVGQDISAVLFSQGAVTPLAGRPGRRAGAKDVAELPLIVRSPQRVRFEDQSFFLGKEGLYSFANWGKVRFADPRGRPEILDVRKRSSCVIRYRRDVLTLLGAFAVLAVHGHTHDALSHAQRLARMKKGAIALTCGAITDFLCRLLPDFGFKTRPIQCHRIEGPYNSYDCGHWLFEFYWPKYRKWVLADVDVHQMFARNGKFLNLAEVKRLFEEGKHPDYHPLTPPGVGLIDTTESVTTDFAGMSQFSHMFLDTRLLREWHRKMFAVTAFVEEGKPGFFYCDDPAGRQRAMAYSPWYTPMDRKTWLAKYYPEEQ